LPFRKLDYDNRYKKYQWLEAQLIKNESDPRPESYKVHDISKVKLIGNVVRTQNSWQERKRIIFSQNPIYENLTELIEKANNNELSLAIFKPNKIIDFIIEEVDREWSKEKLDYLENKARQLSLFQTEEEVKKEFSIVDKLPYKFSYRFNDIDGKESKLMIEDWEIGMLYWNCLKSANGDEKKAVNKVKNKYLNQFLSKDLYLFLGTTKQYHGWASNPFVIVGVFYPPVDNQIELF